MSDARAVDPQVARERLVLALADEALALPADQRAAFLVRRCGDDTDLLRSAERLVTACAEVEEGDPFLNTPAAELAHALLQSFDADRDERSGGDEAPAAVVAALEGRYHMGARLGAGGSATVYRAHDVRHGRDVALKIMRGGVTDPGARGRFLREITIAARLQHPYIVPLLDSGDADGALFYVMPVIEGESLRHRLDRVGALPLPEVLSLARDMAEALDAAHAAGVVHRDIKPQNVLLRDGHAVVADFGIAFAREAAGDARLTEGWMAVGTPLYMSPEQAEGSARVDARSDVYSLGCVVYEMLTGETPYAGATPHAVRAKHLHAPIPDLTVLRPSLKAPLQPVIAQALAKVPGDRFASAGAFVQSLGVAAAGEVPPRARRPSSLVFTAGVALITAATSAIALLVPRESADTGNAPRVVRAGGGVSPPLPDATPAGDMRRIAVLYFDNLTSDAEVGRIATGLTEDLIDALSRVRALRVTSPNGVRPLRENPPPLDSIARTLGVGTVIGGSLSATNATVQASVRMLDPVSGMQLDSRTIAVPRANALVLRDTVTTEIAAFLRRRLGEQIQLAQARERVTSPATWQLIVRADELARDGTTASIQFRDREARDLLDRADSLYRVAQVLDPASATILVKRGWIALYRSKVAPPDRTSNLGSWRGELFTPKAELERAIALADSAHRRGAESADALAMRGYARLLMLQGGYGAELRTQSRLAEADLRAALDERPDLALPWYLLGNVLLGDGRFREAEQALARAYERDAFLAEASEVVNLLYFATLELGRFDEARQWCDLGLSRFPAGPTFTLCRFILLGRMGKTRADLSTSWRSIAEFEGGDMAPGFAPLWAFFRFNAAAVAARAGLVDSARAIDRATHAGLVGARDRDRAGDADAMLHLQLGDRETAARALHSAIRDRPSLRGQLLRSVRFRELASDSSFAALWRDP